MINIRKLVNMMSILIPMLIFSCAKEQKTIEQHETNFKQIFFERFPRTSLLTAKIIETPPVLLQPLGMQMSDELLLVMDFNMSADGYYFQGFDLPELSYVGGFIRKGGAPGEEYAIFPHFAHVEGNQFLYSNLARVRTANFSKINKNVSLIKEVKLPEKWIDFSFHFKLNDDYFATSSTSESEYELLRFDSKSKQVYEFGATFPEIGVELENKNMKNILFNRVAALKPDRQKFAVLYHDYPFMRVYDNGGTLLSETRFQNYQVSPAKAYLKEIIDEQELRTLTMNYKGLQVTNKYIYGLYSGKNNKDVAPVAGAGIEDMSQEIHVWDWLGEPIAKINLDHPCVSFEVSSNNQFIVTTSTSEYDKLFKYDLKDVF